MARQEKESRGLVPGLLSGMATTARTAFRPTHTRQYPDVAPDLPPRSRGVIALLADNCTSCMLCARECPDWCIYIDSHKETIPPASEGGRPRQQNVLDRFAIDFSLCMYCGICIEVCPFDALFWSPEFEYAETDIRDLLHEKERLGEWMATVPPPAAFEPGALEEVVVDEPATEEDATQPPEATR
ncbi:NADH-quinone oxidoreductase subunit I [Calidifontibacter sp. DB0510]|uniref:NADH-quinone oxidoreductase subunit I n=1 Tax=Metallococcus carri TaxID=1656884 RepID=A0A967AZI5_9MICO|nr:NADH-quinone oxidoreductase subunit I [Metallococcus carri]NHN55239.1 NADH-quinone oxidoreductase subunit I [Metallococcus carri]NOP36316.1 NADH-quinone oxidoreductase subunit I [Calidifontibacter sp. DB2511S]